MSTQVVQPPSPASLQDATLLRHLPWQGRMLLALSTGQRILLGFLLAALIAAVTTGIIGLQRNQTLDQQSRFYQNLVQANTTLLEAENVLVLSNIETHVTLSEEGSLYSQETLYDDEQAARHLLLRYDTSLTTYISHQLLYEHPDQTALLAGAEQQELVNEQRILTTSALRTWRLYRESEEQVLKQVASRNVFEAQLLERLQGEPTHADALSALRALRRFNERLTASARDTTNAYEQEQFIITLVAALFAAAGIILAGSLLSLTVVPRLNRLRKVAKSAEQGQWHERLPVIGRDEIADVSAAVNTMLETMVADAIAYEQQRQINEFKDQFILNVSHELRTPLTQVYGYLELLYDFHHELDEQTALKFLSKAKYGCQELMVLVGTVLDATRAKGELNPPRQEEVNVAVLTQDALEQFDPRQRQDYLIQVEIPEDLAVIADKQYMRQVLRNLFSNAFKYSYKQTTIRVMAELWEPPLETRTGNEAAAAVVRICMQDEGPGIPQEELPQLFQKFVRLKRDTAGTVRGTGLGLYVSKQLVEAMHGDMWVESSGKPGEGSRFYIALPAAVRSST